MYVWYNTTILLLRQPHRHPFDRHSLDTEASTSRGTCLNYSPSVLSTKSEYDSRTKTVTVYDVRLCVDTFYFDFHPPGRQQFANSSMRRVLYWPRAVYLAAATSRSYNVGVFIWGCKQTKKMFTSKTFGSYLYSRCFYVCRVIEELCFGRLFPHQTLWTETLLPHDSNARPPCRLLSFFSFLFPLFYIFII